MAAQPPIQVGDVFYLRCTLCNPPKPKFFVVAALDPLRMFLINSRLNEFQASVPEIAACMVLIRATEHVDFLTHDSYVGCNQLSHEYNFAKLSELLVNHPDTRVGALHPHAKEAVSRALAGNTQLSGKYLRHVRPHWP